MTILSSFLASWVWWLLKKNKETNEFITAHDDELELFEAHLEAVAEIHECYHDERIMKLLEHAREMRNKIKEFDDVKKTIESEE